MTKKTEGEEWNAFVRSLVEEESRYAGSDWETYRIKLITEAGFDVAEAQAVLNTKTARVIPKPLHAQGSFWKGVGPADRGSL